MKKYLNIIIFVVICLTLPGAITRMVLFVFEDEIKAELRDIVQEAVAVETQDTPKQEITFSDTHPGGVYRRSSFWAQRPPTMSDYGHRPQGYNPRSQSPGYRLQPAEKSEKR